MLILFQMSFRNVALVFGPTLMRSTAMGHDMLASMNEGYTIVEALCRHVSIDSACKKQLLIIIICSGYSSNMAGR